ncbi:MAG: carboxypeptidase regulatory-like domain-containing protein [FCB group bacterium]|nr:carboxypeptidase regulatory-like domain-containing protein [FCB group bacterium]
MTKVNKLLAVFIVIFGLLFLGCEEDPIGPDYGALQGFVYNSVTNILIGNAVFYSSGDSLGFSNVAGEYLLNLEIGEYDITCNAGGYESITNNFLIEKDQTNNFDFYLTPLNTVIMGLITNANTGEAIVGAVINDGTSDVTTSGANGTYSFGIDEGTYTLTCTAEGYNMQEIVDVEVEWGDTVYVDFQLQPITVILIVNDIVGNNTWTNNNIYLIDGEILISAVLTINPGTKIKFKDGANWVVQGAAGGLIIAEGTALLPIIFTSYMDDSFGGDTNEDGNTTSPLSGDWMNINIIGANNSSTFEYCEYYYGGSDDEGTIILDNNTQVSVMHCIIAHNNGAHGALDAGKAGSGTIIQNNIFYDNIIPLKINTNFDINNSNSFHDPDNSSVINEFNAIFIGYDGTNNYISGTIDWEETEVPFAFPYLGIFITPGNTLELASGVVLKFDGGSILYQGDNLTNWDANEVYFTSYKDDDHGGDTNGDGPSIGVEGDWEGIYDEGVQPGDWEEWENILYDDIH